MDKWTLTIIAGLGLGILSCSKDPNKSAPANDPGMKTASFKQVKGEINRKTLPCSEQTGRYTDKMKLDLDLSADQEKSIRRINGQRAYQLQALEKENLRGADKMKEIGKINKRTYSLYKNVMTDQQYNRFLSTRDEYDEFPVTCDNFKDGEDSQVKGDIQTDSDLNISNYKLNIY